MFGTNFPLKEVSALQLVRPCLTIRSRRGRELKKKRGKVAPVDGKKTLAGTGKGTLGGRQEKSDYYAQEKVVRKQTKGQG